MVQISNPSTVPVTGFQSMAQNFGENSKNFLCQLTFGTGSYAIGARVLGLAKFTPQTALLTSGALLTALALCPSGADSGAILGKDSPALGGQCSTVYFVDFAYSYYTDRSGNTRSISDRSGAALGPLKIVSLPDEGLVTGEAVDSELRIVDSGGNPIVSRIFSLGIVPNSLNLTYVRRDGLPDNCGNQGPIGGQLTRDPAGGDTINSNNVIDNSQIIGIAPTIIDMGGINTTLDLSYSDYSIHSFSPFTYTVNIGGARYGFEQQPDGTNKPFPVNPDPDLPTDQNDSWKKILDKLKAIEECVCSDSGAEFKEVTLPFIKKENCQLLSETLFVPKSFDSRPIVDEFIGSASLASIGCATLAPVQMPEKLIYAATSLQDGRELFTGDIEPEVVALRIRIDSFSSGLIPRITTYPAANQYKFGSCNFTTKNSPGGGDYIYIFDEDTYLPLPRRGKTGRLRILFKERISFSVYDTGERL